MWQAPLPFYDADEKKIVWANYTGSMLNLASPDGETFSVDAEIRRLKDWWAEHGEDFLQGKPVPNPNITSVFSSS